MRRPMDILLPKGCGNEEKMSVIEKIFGTHSSRELKRIEPLVDKIEALRPTMQALSDEELRGKTEEYKKRLTEGETLDDLLPEAYATVREAAKRVLNMEHYRVQLIGGIILHQGRIAEMRTGEGKTLVSTLPAYLNALEGKGVHVVTVNDYLAKRDAEWMGQLVAALLIGSSHLPSNSTSLTGVSVVLACTGKIPINVVMIITILHIFFFILFNFMTLCLF